MDMRKHIIGMGPCYVYTHLRDPNEEKRSIETKCMDENHKNRVDEYMIWYSNKVEVSLSNMFEMGSVIGFQKFFIAFNWYKFLESFNRFYEKYESDIRNEI